MLAGGCLCGDVRWKTEAQPTGTGICHCVTCRKSTGAPMVAWTVFPRDAVEVSGRTAAFVSSPEAQRRHCHRCGTQLFFDDTRYSDEIEITTASFDDPDLVTPEKHIWAESRIHWVKLDDGLPVYAKRSVGDDVVVLSPARDHA